MDPREFNPTEGHAPERAPLVHQSPGEGKVQGNIAPLATARIRFFRLILGPLREGDGLTRSNVLNTCEAILPRATIFIAQVGAGCEGQVRFHLALKIPNSPKRRQLWLMIQKAFSGLGENEIQIKGLAGWNRLRARIMRDDPKGFLYIGEGEEEVKPSRGRRPLDSFWKDPSRRTNRRKGAPP